MAVQWRTIIEWEYDEALKQQRVLRQFTTPLSGYVRKPKKQEPAKTEIELQAVGEESWN